MARKNRKIRKRLGSRTCGYGCAKKHRGSGSRGGRGNAGSGRHKQKGYSISGKSFGKTGFHRPSALVKKIRPINIGDINLRIEQWAQEGSAKKIAGGYLVDVGDLGYDKVLGSGKLTHKIEVKASYFSESAKEKITAAGGKAIAEDIESSASG